ncbi:hypothetical protein HK098_001514 [Nowakowskiella sp. JEL0407]|nr:hypothetical protein HK098_001514 [Nowakowskiella sp. JEL0407]
MGYLSFLSFLLTLLAFCSRSSAFRHYKVNQRQYIPPISPKRFSPLSQSQYISPSHSQSLQSERYVAFPAVLPGVKRPVGPPSSHIWNLINNIRISGQGRPSGQPFPTPEFDPNGGENPPPPEQSQPVVGGENQPNGGENQPTGAQNQPNGGENQPNRSIFPDVTGSLPPVPTFTAIPPIPTQSQNLPTIPGNPLLSTSSNIPVPTATSSKLSSIPWKADHSMFSTNNGIYVYGGVDNVSGNATENIYFVNGVDMSRSDVTTVSGSPGKIVGQSCALNPANRLVYCSGGFRQDAQGAFIPTNKIWSFDTKFNELTVNGDILSRGFHSSAIINNTLYIFGGQNCYNCDAPTFLGIEGTYTVDLTSLTVTPLFTSQPANATEFGILPHSSALVFSNKILITGGGAENQPTTRNFTFLQFSPTAGPAYFKPVSFENGPPPGYGYSTQLINEKTVVITGGCTATQDATVTWVCDFDTQRLRFVCQTASPPSDASLSPGKRCRNAYTSYKSALVTHGGLKWNANSFQKSDSGPDLYWFKVSSNKWESEVSVQGVAEISPSPKPNNSTNAAGQNENQQPQPLHLNGGLIALVTIFGAIVLLIIGVVIYCFIHRPKPDDDDEEDNESLLDELKDPKPESWYQNNNIPPPPSTNVASPNQERNIQAREDIYGNIGPNTPTGYKDQPAITTTVSTDAASSSNPAFVNNHETPHSTMSSTLSRRGLTINRPPNISTTDKQTVHPILVPLSPKEYETLKRMDHELPMIRSGTPLDPDSVFRSLSEKSQLPHRKDSTRSFRDKDAKFSQMSPPPSFGETIPDPPPKDFSPDSDKLEIPVDTTLYDSAVESARKTTLMRLHKKGSQRWSQNTVNEAFIVATAGFSETEPVIVESEVEETLLLKGMNDYSADVKDPAETGTIAEPEELLPFKALYPHVPAADDELALEVGDIVYISKIYEDGWGRGVNVRTNSVGAFPLFAVEFEDSSNILTPSVLGSQSEHI